MDTLIHNGQLLPLDGKGLRARGYVGIQDGHIAVMGEGEPTERAACEVDAGGMVIMPALVDCHTHLMEFAANGVYHAQGPAQGLAGLANWMQALRHGVVTLGEHHLGHPVLRQPMEEYQNLAEFAPMEVYLAFGECIIGTEPLTHVAAIAPGSTLRQPLGDEDWAAMAQASDFPGESIFLNATVANLPAHLAPRAGEVTYSLAELRYIVDLFHRHGRRVGAHIEGMEAAELFLQAGGDVIHHGHGLEQGFGKRMASAGMQLVATPHAGTGSRPTSPAELYDMYKDGVCIAIATDSYIPPHPEASWYDFAAGHEVSPADLARVAAPVLAYFLAQGEPLDAVMAMLTSNAYKILNPALPGAGTLTPGAPAHILLSPGLPGVDVTDLSLVQKVWWRGQLVISK